MQTQPPLRFHLSLNVERSRFDETVEFYTRVFGAPPVKRKVDYAKFEPDEPYVNLAMNAVDGAVSRGELDHLGVQLFSDEALAAARARVVAAGLAVRDEREVECCYAGQNKFWVTDPTGRQVEFFHVLRHVEPAPTKRMPLRVLATLATAPTGGSAGACCTPDSGPDGARES